MSDLERLTEERLEALLEQDWDRYNQLGERILSMLPQGPIWPYQEDLPDNIVELPERPGPPDDICA